MTYFENVCGHDIPKINDVDKALVNQSLPTL